MTELEVGLMVDAPRQVVWEVVTDIERAETTIAAIEKIEVLERPEQGILGLKWRETRKMFGKSAVETMWVTEVEEGSHYCTEARSHGSIYRTKVFVEDTTGGTRVGMWFGGEAQSFVAKLMATVCGPMMKGAMEKALLKDLQDIAAAAKSRAG